MEPLSDDIGHQMKGFLDQILMEKIRVGLRVGLVKIWVKIRVKTSSVTLILEKECTLELLRT